MDVQNYIKQRQCFDSEYIHDNLEQLETMGFILRYYALEENKNNANKLEIYDEPTLSGAQYCDELQSCLVSFKSPMLAKSL